MNNPLLYTDPSGYWSFRSFFKSVINIFAPIIAVLPPQISSIIIGVVSTFCGPYAYLCNGAGQAALAYYHGASASEAIRSGIKAGAQAYLFQMAGEVPGADSSARYLAHAAAGCGGAIISGGGSSGCARGAASAVLGKWVTNNTSGSDWNTFTRGVAAAVSGGVTSQMMGGSFANGATTAAMGFLFNEILHSDWSGSERQRMQASGYEQFENIEPSRQVKEGNYRDFINQPVVNSCQSVLSCSPLDVTGVGYDSEGNKWGKYYCSCMTEGDSATFIGPGKKTNLYGVSEFKEPGVGRFPRLTQEIKSTISIPFFNSDFYKAYARGNYVVPAVK